MDDSEIAQRALEYSLGNHPDAEITVLRVVGEPSQMMGAATGLALEEAADEHAKVVFDRARELATPPSKAEPGPNLTTGTLAAPSTEDDEPAGPTVGVVPPLCPHPVSRPPSLVST